jgi:tRNA-splicing ligase RtcB
MKLKHVFGDPDAGAVRQIETCLQDERAVAGALMADHHLGYSMPIGGVVAYKGAISPSGVGFDIACGNKAVRTNVPVAELLGTGPILRAIADRVAFGLGRNNSDPIEHSVLEDERWKIIDGLDPKLREAARVQLGTVGSGNHYVDLLSDEDGWLWVACHFGSRGFGYKVASGFLSIATGKTFTDRIPESEDPAVLDIGTPSGDTYRELMELAGDYAYAGRDYVIEQVLSVLDNPEVTESVHCHHNYAWFEDGLWIVRKGATPLTSEPEFIGGSMGDISVIVSGTGEDIGALGSAPHGAGRLMSRTKAAGKFKKQTVTRTAPDGSTYTKKIRVRDKSTALIDFDEVKSELAQRGVSVWGAGADEAPAVYKDLRTVLSQHSNIEVKHTLTPIGVVMAGEDIFDPFKD